MVAGGLAVISSAGIIVIDPIFDYSVEAQMVGGPRTLGLDPSTIKYVLVSHGHYNHVGGARWPSGVLAIRIRTSSAPRQWPAT